MKNMHKQVTAVIIILIFCFLFSVLNPLPAGEIVSESENPITITILAGQSTSDAGTEEMMAKVLEEKFPGVQFEWICVDWGDWFASQAEGQFLSGNVPDILIGKAQDVSKYKANGMIKPLDRSAYANISQDTLDMVSEDGEIYGLPYTESFQGVLYNKAIFAEYRLEPPETLAELEHIVKVLKNHDVIPFACHFQESWKVGNMNMQFLMNDIFIDDDIWGDHFRADEVQFAENERMKTLFENNRYILEHSFTDAIQIDQYESDVRFARGEAAMYLTGTWSLQALSQMVPEVEAGLFPYPNQSGDAKLLVETNMTFMKGNTAENEELVDQILEVLGTDEELAKEIVDYTQSKSTFKPLRDYGSISIQDDINEYQNSGRLLNVGIGNGQLVWDYQNDVAAQTLLWLQGRISLDEVFAYADENRGSSSVVIE